MPCSRSSTRRAIGYAAPVTQAQHLAYLKPLHDARQQLLQHELRIEPTPLQLLHDTDSLWQRAHAVQPEPAAPRAARARAQPGARWRRATAAMDAERSPRWEDVRKRLRYEAGARYDPAVEFAQPSPYVPRLHALRDYALASFRARPSRWRRARWT